MRKVLALITMSAVAVAALAGPTLTTAPYPPGSVQPTDASLSVNGTATLPCTIVPGQQGVTPTCDLSSLAAPGVYVLVLSVSNLADCVASTPDTTTCASGGVSKSDPHTLTLRATTLPPFKVKVTK